jgi:diadenosine tetraphosphate (Ap4A) HIT family hydrolase
VFTVHPQLAADCFDLGSLELCQLLLMNDERFPWCILVPRVANLRDLHDVPRDRRTALFDEIERVSATLQDIAHADKINVAALGNMVPQLHIHVIARTTTDDAWPRPVWGVGTARPYPQDATRIEQIRKALRVG